MEQLDSDCVLWTPRLLLRRPAADDVGAVLRLHQNPLAIAHNPGDALEDETAAGQRLDRWIEHWAQHGIGYFAVSWRHDHGAFGFCGIKVMTLHGRPVSNLMYRLDPRLWGRGIATEAASAVVARTLRRYPGRPVIARVRPENHASARVAIKSGLTRAPGLDTAGADGVDHVFTSEGPTTIPPAR